jgi:hypothetical protein
MSPWEAARIAAGCPILEIGGLVEVRPIRQLDIMGTDPVST